MKIKLVNLKKYSTREIWYSWNYIALQYSKIMLICLFDQCWNIWKPWSLVSHESCKVIDVDTFWQSTKLMLDLKLISLSWWPPTQTPGPPVAPPFEIFGPSNISKSMHIFYYLAPYQQKAGYATVLMYNGKVSLQLFCF